MDRVVVVVPYLSIIEQTAKEFRKVFKRFGDSFILEHHSMADLRIAANVKAEDGEDEAERQRRLLCQNWDAPIIVTTSVQFFESLFANTPGACRKLHNIANSVVIFDEAQTFPPHLARPTLATLNILQQDFNVTVVFGTATQPAFDGLDENWKPYEIVQDVQGCFRAMSRANVSLPKPNISLTWEEVANNLLASERVLCIVNLKRHAQQIIEIMKGKMQKKEHATLFHLSTNMCPAHRQAELKIVRKRLKKGYPVRLISTQCIEAGVDIDFPEVWRSLGPLDSIAQAAGRCNREGRLPRGQVFVFRIDEALPKNMMDYQQAINQTSITLSNREALLLEELQVYREYFKGLYKTKGLDDPSQDDWAKLIDSYDFPEIHKRYKMIDNDTVSVIVPYGDEGREICNKLEATRFNQAYFKEAQKFMVNLYRSALRNPDFSNHCVQIGKTGLYLWKGPYDDLLGLTTGIRFDGIYIA